MPAPERLLPHDAENGADSGAVFDAPASSSTASSTFDVFDAVFDAPWACTSYQLKQNHAKKANLVPLGALASPLHE